MKSLIFAMLLSFCSQYGQAQAEFDMQIDPKKLNEYLQQNKPVKQKISPLALLQLASDTARYSRTTIQGDIYALPQDKMPCLVPDKNADGYNERQLLLNKSQPSLLFRNDTLFIGPAPGNKMPNAYRGKPLVWEKKP